MLIVPYGIETKSITFVLLNIQVLIVPYGIETNYFEGRYWTYNSVNCTLWN